MSVWLRFRIVLSLVVVLPVCNGCITYYRADPLAGLNLTRETRRPQLDFLVSRYHASSYFDGSDRTPHTHSTEVDPLQYRRDDFILRCVFPVSNLTRGFVAIPISHLVQRSPDGIHGGTDDWGIEHIWLGMGYLPFEDRRSAFLVTFGAPIDGSIGDLIGTTGDYNDAPRLSFQYIFASRQPYANTACYFRVGAGAHLGGRNTSGPVTYSPYETANPIFEFPGEFQLTIPIRHRVALGPFMDARFVVMDHGGDTGIRSRDAVAVGPMARVRLGRGLEVNANYRHEIIGFLSSAGSSWNLALGLLHN